MDGSPGMSRAHASMEVRALVTPTRRRNRPSSRLHARGAAEPYRRRSSQMTPPSELSPPNVRQRCVSTGLAQVQSSLPSPEPDNIVTPISKSRLSASTIEVISLISEDELSEPDKIVTPIFKTRISTSTTEFISLISEDELSEPESARTRPQVPTSTQSAPAVPSARRADINDATPTRPRLPRRAKSEPPREPSTTPAGIDKRIQAMIRKPLTPKQSSSKEVGNNYVFEVVTEEHPGTKVVKVGFTKGLEQHRLKKIARYCKHLVIKEQDDPEHMPIRLFKRAEDLAHKELEDYKHSFQCKCNVKDHKEYFNIDKSVAIEIVQRWRWFCIQEPYDSSGKLKPFWERRLRHFTSSFGFPGTTIDHEERANRWRKFIDYSAYPVLWYDLTETIVKLWPRRWLIVALIEGFIILILLKSRDTMAYVLAFMVVGALLEICDVQQPMSFMTFNWWAYNIRRRALRPTSLASLENTCSKTAIIDDEDEILEPSDVEDGVDDDLDDMESNCSSDIESSRIEVDDDEDDTIEMEDDDGAASAQSNSSVEE